MPWLETSPVEQRKEFIAAVVRGQHSFAEVCRRFGISRKNGYKWWNRHLVELATEGQCKFEDRSRKPHRSPKALPVELENLIVDARKERPTWGPKKLRAWLLKANPRKAFPSVSTFAAVL